MGNLQEFHRKVADDLVRIKEAIASGTLDALLGHRQWYDYCFHPANEGFRAYHMAKFQDAEAVVVMDPYDIYDDDVIDRLIEVSNPKGCYDNAVMVSETIEADYVEGYILSESMSFLIQHAWNKTDEGHFDITGEGQDKFDWTEVGMEASSRKGRRPFRETFVYIALETFSAEKAVSEWRELRETCKVMGGSLSLAKWLSENLMGTEEGE